MLRKPRKTLLPNFFGVSNCYSFLLLDFYQGVNFQEQVLRITGYKHTDGLTEVWTSTN